MKQIIITILIAINISSTFKIRLSNNPSLRNQTLDELRHLQMRLWFPNFKKATTAQIVKLTQFKINRDKEQLAYSGTILIGLSPSKPLPQSQSSSKPLPPTQSQFKIGMIQQKVQLKYRLKQVSSNKEFQQPQSFQVLFDTGSYNLFVLGEECNSLSCKNHRKYRRNIKARIIQDNETLQYVSGISQGQTIEETVSIGNLTVKDQLIHVGQKVKIPVFMDSQWDGVVGLGHCIHKQNCSVNPDGFIDNLHKHKLVKHNMFIFNINQNQSFLLFGEYPVHLRNVHEQNKIQWAGLFNVTDDVTWSLKLKNINIKYRTNRLAKDESINPCQKGCRLLIDTGTYLNYVPEELFRYFFRQLQTNDCRMISQMPDIELVIEGVKADVNVLLKSSQYMEKYSINGQENCVSSFAADSIEEDIITMGQYFLQTQICIFDFDQQRIGFYIN